jgi:hypothetical protein
MCVLARGFDTSARRRLTIVDFHHPSRNSLLTAGAVIASAGLRPLVPYTCRRRSGPSREKVVAPPSDGLFRFAASDELGGIRVLNNGIRHPAFGIAAIRRKREGPTGVALVP